MLSIYDEAHYLAAAPALPRAARVIVQVKHVSRKRSQFHGLGMSEGCVDRNNV